MNICGFSPAKSLWPQMEVGYEESWESCVFKGKNDIYSTFTLSFFRSAAFPRAHSNGVSSDDPVRTCLREKGDQGNNIPA